MAQHPHELITYGGNGAVFQNWAQYRLTMQYLSEMTDSQTAGDVFWAIRWGCSRRIPTPRAWWLRTAW